MNKLSLISLLCLQLSIKRSQNVLGCLIELKVFSEKPFNSLVVSANSIFIDDAMTFPDSFTLIDILTEVAPFYANWNSSLAKGLFDYFSFNPKQPHSNLTFTE